MTTAARTRSAVALDGIHLTFAGLVRSEWVKLRTLRSTVWCYVLIVALMITFGVLTASGVPRSVGGGEAAQVTVFTSTAGMGFIQLIAMVLGVLVIAGEYRTGMIRSTLAAAPGRVGVYLAKVLVLAAATLVVAAASIGVTAAVAAPVLVARGVTSALGRGDVLSPLLGATVYLALIAVLAFTVGVIVRNTAGGIASIAALVFVLPAVLSAVAASLHNPVWLQNIAALLPATAGGALYMYVPAGATLAGQPGVIALTAVTGAAVLAAWIVVLGALGMLLLRRRDV